MALERDNGSGGGDIVFHGSFGEGPHRAKNRFPADLRGRFPLPARLHARLDRIEVGA